MNANLALVFDVQRFCVHDGPGIRTVVFFKGCGLRCAWCQNPEGLEAKRELAVYGHRCDGCGDCVERCQPGALRLAGDRVEVEWTACTHCQDCVSTCHTQALVTVGEEVTGQELTRRCLQDAAYYRSSGGGVTLSGGEPVLQSEFLAKWLPALRTTSSDDLHVLLETAGQYPWARLESILPWVDEVYFDWKVTGADDHESLLGVRAYRAADNLRRLVATGTPVTVRVPLVPGMNDSASQLTTASGQLSELGVSEIQVLPYHGLWESKLPRLDTRRPPLGVSGRLSWRRVQRELGGGRLRVTCDEDAMERMT